MWDILRDTVAYSLLLFFAIAACYLLRTVWSSGRGPRQGEVGTLLSLLGSALCIAWWVWETPPFGVWISVSLVGYALIYRSNPAGARAALRQFFHPKSNRETAREKTRL